jgi:GNAT superfamily N-acetyltransferase
VYRLSKKPSICYGLFCTTAENQDSIEGTGRIANQNLEAVGTDTVKLRLVMAAHAISTLGKSKVVTETDMDLPGVQVPIESDADGRTICLHSFAVSPEFQGKGLGRAALDAYLRTTAQLGTADRVALICKEVRVIEASVHRNLLNGSRI